MAESTTQELLEIAGVELPLEEAVDALQRYPMRAPLAYDLVGVEIAETSAADLLRRTRKVSSRLSEKDLEAMVERAADAPYDDGVHAADLQPNDEAWAAAGPHASQPGCVTNHCHLFVQQTPLCSATTST